MRKQLYYSVAVLLSTCLHSHASNINPGTAKYEHVDKITNDYLCKSAFFDSETVKKSYQIGCYKLWNAESRMGFPAKLKDDKFVNRAHKTLFSWPLNYDKRISRTS